MSDGNESRIAELRDLIADQKRVIAEDREFYNSQPGGWPAGAADSIRAMTDKLYQWERELDSLR